jgi:hypothetical protein
MSHAKPLGYYRCRACKTVWKGEQLNQDPQSTVLVWTCGGLSCGGTVDGIPPDEIAATLNAAQPGKPDGVGELVAAVQKFLDWSETLTVDTRDFFLPIRFDDLREMKAALKKVWEG